MNVSIFTPSNNSQFLPEVYKSIKDQPFFEWIVVLNNGAKAITFDDPRVKIFDLEISSPWIGPLKAYACARARGDILLELDHDDLLMPTAIEEVINAFQNSSVGFIYSNTIHCTGDFKPVNRFDERFGWKYRPFNYNGSVLDECVHFEPTPDCVSKIWFAPNHLRAFRKNVYDLIGGYAKNMRVLDDLDIMCRFYRATEFKHIDKPLYLYRIHGDNSWLKNNQEIQDNVMRIYDQYIESLTERWADVNGLRKIELGGRINAKPGYETVDLKDADIICDLNKIWPFPADSVGALRAIDVFEHLDDQLHVMKELYRVLAPGGWAFIKVPSTDGRGAFQDPLHKSFWNGNSFFYYTKANFAKYIDSPVRFQASRLYTTEKNQDGVCWTIAHLVSLKNNYRPAGLVEI